MIKTTGRRALSPLASMLILAGLVLFFGALLQMLIAFPLGQLLTGGNITGNDFLMHPEEYPNGWLATMLNQGIASFSAYIVAPMIFWYWIGNQNVIFAEKSSLDPIVWTLVLVLVIVYIPFNSLIYEWNQRLPVPEWMSNSEERLDKLTKFLTNFTSFGQFMLGMLVVGVIPAIGEEFLFRGTVQKLFERWWGNPHLAIWLAAAIFSAIHVQFLGFFPRMLLGALFGYLYVWTRNLWVPIWAHFVNNGFMVIMMYLRNQKMIDIDIEDNTVIPLPGAILSMGLSVGLMWLIHKRSVSEVN
ncbi:MAG: CPBP family intramembrane metalloprotease [Siphonobacter sp.]